MKRVVRFSLVWGLLVGAAIPLLADEPASPTAAAGPDPHAAELFEKHVRPVLVERCQKCHGAEKQKGGLHSTAPRRSRHGGESGVVIVPGQPDASPLVRAINYADEPQMPPDGKLSGEQIALVTEWVKLGAHWPADPPRIAGTDSQARSASAANHWAFQPILEPPLPAENPAAPPEWKSSPIDRFVLARQRAAGLTPSARAERRTLIRRATFDLTGLPPKPEDAVAFAADDSPEAWPRLVERLLASPRYGERWGRHWLDVARYSDTKGYTFQRGAALSVCLYLSRLGDPFASTKISLTISF